MHDVDDPFDQLPVGAFRLSADLRTVRVNRHLANYLGIAPGVLSREQRAALPKMGVLGEQWTEAAQTVLKDGKTALLEFSLPKEGGARSISMRFAPERDAQGQIIGLICVAIDVSETQRVEKALHDAQSRFQAFMDHLPVCTWVKDGQGRHEFINKAYAERFKIEEWAGKTDAQLWPGEMAERFERSDREVRESGQAQAAEQTVDAGDGRRSHWWVHKFPFRDAGGREYVGGVALDVTERRDLEMRLRESEARFQAFLDHSPAIAWMKDEQGHYLFMSRSYIEFLGLSEQGWRGLTDFDLFPAEFAQRCRDQELDVLAEGRAREHLGPAPDVSGRQREWLLVRFPFSDGAGRRFIGGVATDVTERRRVEEQMRLQSLTDELTGLYNRRGFALLAEPEYRVAARRQLRCALLLVDLDGLKLINDRHGHDAGDQALVGVAEALRVAARNSDIIGRIGGDEFVVFAVGCEDTEALRNRLLAAIGSWNEHMASNFTVSASIGVSEFVADVRHPLDQLMAEADARMYDAKRARRASNS